jgi:citrate lyase subunit beta/citryl-CoA lyase
MIEADGAVPTTPKESPVKLHADSDLPVWRSMMFVPVNVSRYVEKTHEVAESVERRKRVTVGHTRLMLLVETPEAFSRIWEIAAAHPRNVALSLGAEDFASETRSAPDPDVLLYPKQQVVFAARAAGILPRGGIATVADDQDLSGYPDLVRRSRGFGFQGATCIPPGICRS